jgi:hypothetical protein
MGVTIEIFRNKIPKGDNTNSDKLIQQLGKAIHNPGHTFMMTKGVWIHDAFACVVDGDYAKILVKPTPPETPDPLAIQHQDNGVTITTAVTEMMEIVLNQQKPYWLIECKNSLTQQTEVEGIIIYQFGKNQVGQNRESLYGELFNYLKRDPENVLPTKKS